HVRPEPKEGVEAVRALQSGARTLAAVHLRDGDAAGALRAIDRANAREIARDDLLHALESVVDKPDAVRWLDVLHAMRPPPTPNDGHEDEDLDDKEVLRAAAWCVAMEAYRLDPS